MFNIGEIKLDLSEVLKLLTEYEIVIGERLRGTSSLLSPERIISIQKKK